MLTSSDFKAIRTIVCFRGKENRYRNLLSQCRAELSEQRNSVQQLHQHVEESREQQKSTFSLLHLAVQQIHQQHAKGR